MGSSGRSRFVLGCMASFVPGLSIALPISEKSPGRASSGRPEQDITEWFEIRIALAYRARGRTSPRARAGRRVRVQGGTGPAPGNGRIRGRAGACWARCTTRDKAAPSIFRPMQVSGEASRMASQRTPLSSRDGGTSLKSISPVPRARASAPYSASDKGAMRVALERRGRKDVDLFERDASRRHGGCLLMRARRSARFRRTHP
ncbi:hypothetical protein SAMN06295900_119110 [Trinickia caryophylli]|uniref:Uncharacterized protein n=1 Tax=Trinickia caryophylli TaxID=28094 RepID=A0A1X7H183_TRICW|nr:hypothetical protein SAMN06295900_119110 [Trinickia caryophylli]